MVDWKSPVEVMKDARIFANLMHICLGLYAWEFAMSLDFDFDFILMRKRFRWPLIFYFTGRYCLLFTLLGLVVSQNITERVNCQALYLFIQLSGTIALGCASINLSIRTIAVWSQSKYVTAGLILVILGHWSLCLQAIVVKGAWVDGQGCIVVDTNHKILPALFIYTMCFDFLVMCLMTWKLGVQAHERQTRLTKLIFHDGLIFFFVAFFANALATTFIMLDLNPIMSTIFDIPAVVASTIVASRAVRRLSDYTNSSAELFSLAASSAVARGTNSLGLRSNRNLTAPRKSDGVLVQMDTYTDTDADTQVQGKSFFDDSTTRAAKLPDAEVPSDLESDYKRPTY